MFRALLSRECRAATGEGRGRAVKPFPYGLEETLSYAVFVMARAGRRSDGTNS